MTLLPVAHVYCLASEWDRLTTAQQAQVTMILIDDGEWSPEQIFEAIASPPIPFSPDDWTRP